MTGPFSLAPLPHVSQRSVTFKAARAAADISYWVNLFRDIQLADFPRVFTELLVAPGAGLGQKTEGQATSNHLLDSGTHAKVSKMGKVLKEKILKLCSESLLQPFWNKTLLLFQIPDRFI